MDTPAPLSSPLTSVQARDEAELAGTVARWRAAETVRARITDAEEREELLGALGLLDATRPAER